MISTKDQRIKSLISKMTLEEKISHLMYDTPAIDRLDIPKHNYWNECLHGVGRAGLATVFPQAIGLAATWNPELMARVTKVISNEARAKHHEAARRNMTRMYTGLVFWSPNINIFRDPRWGRGQETYGEDPYLTTVMGITFVKGIQGNHPPYLKLAATPKHFAVHSGPEADRHHFDAIVGQRDMYETYLPAFEACVKEGGAVSVMGAYNRTNGEPCCASETLLEKILRQEWGFDGYVVSDCGAILDIFAHHKVVENAAQASAMAVKAGCDLNCGEVYLALKRAVKAGLITEAEISKSVERLFKVRDRLGILVKGQTSPYADIPFDVVDSPKHRELALEAARQSIVLLKNENNLLPLSKEIKSIAVIGPNADDLAALHGNYQGTAREPITLLDGIRRVAPAETEIYYTPGCNIAPGVPPLVTIPAEFFRPEMESGSKSGLRASYYDDANFTGNPSIQQIDACVDFIWNVTWPISKEWGQEFAVRWEGFLLPPVSGEYQLGLDGCNEYALYLDGELVLNSNEIHHAIFKRKNIHLDEGKAYSIQVDFINRGLDPQIKLLWYRPDRDLRAESLEVARNAEIIIAALGLNPNLEREEMPVEVKGFYGGDRTDIALPQPQLELLKELHATGKPIILVLQSGCALAIDWEAENLPAILAGWYPGQAGGQALAEVVFGEYNPAGRLPVTFYRSTQDLPPFEDYDMEGRTYRYFRGEPLYPFGHGLSYTSFDYENLTMNSNRIHAGDRISISFEVINTGDQTGGEVVQLYLAHDGVPAPRPIKELKGFTRLSLMPGERKKVTFTLGMAHMRSYVTDIGWQVLPGGVTVMVGRSSQDLPLSGQFEIVGGPTAASDPREFISKTDVEPND